MSRNTRRARARTAKATAEALPQSTQSALRTAENGDGVLTPGPPLPQYGSGEGENGQGGVRVFAADSGAAPAGGAGKVASAGWEEMEAGPYKKFCPRPQLIAEYWLMRTYEPTAKRVLALLRTLIIKKLGAYQHPNAKVAETVNGLLARVEGGVARIVGDMLSALWAGFAVAEPIWATGASEWWVERVDLLHPLTFFNKNSGLPEERDGIRLDPKTGKVEKLRQYPMKPGGEGAEFAAADVLYWPMFAELREEVYGASLLAAARRGWFSKTRIENYWNTFAQKAAMPTPVFVVPPGTIKDAAGNEVRIGQLLVDMWERNEPGAGLAIPGSPDFDVKVMTLVPSDGASTTFERLTSYWKNELFNSMFTPRIVLEEPEHASRAQTGTVLDLYFMLIDGLRLELGTVLVSQLISRLLEHNVGTDVEPGTWGWDELQITDMESLARVFETVERGKAEGMTAGLPFVPADEARRREVFPSLYAPAGEAPEAFGRAAPASGGGGGGGVAAAQARRYG